MEKYFFVKSGNEFVKIQIADILYLRSCYNYVKIVTAQGTYLSAETFEKMERLFKKYSFCRIHRFYIVSLDHVERFNRSSVKINNKRIPISDHYRHELKNSIIIIGRGGNQEEGEAVKNLKTYVMQEN